MWRQLLYRKGFNSLDKHLQVVACFFVSLSLHSAVIEESAAASNLDILAEIQLVCLCATAHICIHARLATAATATASAYVRAHAYAHNCAIELLRRNGLSACYR